jgi:hypothetical protein
MPFLAPKSRLIGIVLAIILIAFTIWAYCLGANSIKLLFRSFTNDYLFFTGALAVLSTLSMAVIQTGKDLIPLQRWFQEIKTRHWLRLKAAEAGLGSLPATTPQEIIKQRLARRGFARFMPDLHLAFAPGVYNSDDEQVAVEAEADLLRLATAGDNRAFYDLPIEQLCGQMNAASQVVLDYPARHPKLLDCLASLAIYEDRATLRAADVHSELAALRDKTDARTAEEEKRFRELSQRLIDARSRVANQIHRSIDAFQISVGYRWKWYMQVASFQVSFAITAIALYTGVWVPPGGGSVSQNWPAIFVIGVIGGFLAPVVRDVQTLIQQIRK